MDKNWKTAASSVLTVHCKACAVRRTLQVTSSSSRRYHSVAARRWCRDESARWQRLTCGLCLVKHL